MKQALKAEQKELCNLKYHWRGGGNNWDEQRDLQVSGLEYPLTAFGGSREPYRYYAEAGQRAGLSEEGVLSFLVLSLNPKSVKSCPRSCY